MASGHVNRTNRPNTWLHRPATRREDSPCQLGAVHTWHEAADCGAATSRQILRVERTCHGRGGTAESEPKPDIPLRPWRAMMD